MTYIIGTGAMGCLWGAQCLLNSVSAHGLVSHSYYKSRYSNVTKGNSVESYSSAKEQLVESKRFQYRPYSVDLKPNIIELDLPQLLIGEALPDDNRPILICTKSYKTLEAITPFKTALEGKEILLFQNGFGVHEEVALEFNRSKVYAAVTTEGANLSARNDSQIPSLVHAGLGTTIIGPLNDLARQQGTTSVVEKLTPTKLKLDTSDDIQSHLLKKLIINCSINPFTAILGCANGIVPKQSFFQELWPSLRRELSEFCRLKRVCMNESDIEALVYDIMAKTALNKSSMYQDILNGRSTEVQHINGYVYQTLKQAGLAHESNQLLYESVLALHP